MNMFTVTCKYSYLKGFLQLVFCHPAAIHVFVSLSLRKHIPVINRRHCNANANNAHQTAVGRGYNLLSNQNKLQDRRNFNDNMQNELRPAGPPASMVCVHIVISLRAKEVDERSFIFGSWVCCYGKATWTHRGQTEVMCAKSTDRQRNSRRTGNLSNTPTSNNHH